MEKIINIAELLKDCPQGMELDCAMWSDVKFDEVEMGDSYPICIKVGEGYEHLTEFGHWDLNENAKCVIFPKGKTTWEGFQSPFKDGDIVATADGMWIGITAGGNKKHIIPTYCIIQGDGKFEAYLNKKEKWAFDRVATEEEKEALFKAIKENGYSWNAETKTLEKLFEPKFDITTLKPFESRVLVRDSDVGIWLPEFFGCLCDDNDYPYMIVGGTRWKCCIPYEGNEHLLGTTDSCADFYKTWED